MPNVPNVPETEAPERPVYLGLTAFRVMNAIERATARLQRLRDEADKHIGGDGFWDIVRYETVRDLTHEIVGILRTACELGSITKASGELGEAFTAFENAGRSIKRERSIPVLSPMTGEIEP